MLELHGYYPGNVSVGLGICLHTNCVLVQQYSSQSFFIDYVNIYIGFSSYSLNTVSCNIYSCQLW